MATPVVESIALLIEARLKNVTETNGYEVTTSGVVRPKKINLEPVDREIRLVQGTPEIVGGLEGNAYSFGWRQPFLIGVYVFPSDEDVEPLDTRLNFLRSSVEKALTTPDSDGKDWAQWGGLAIQSEFGEPGELVPERGNWTGYMLVLNVDYHTPHNNPFTAAAV